MGEGVDVHCGHSLSELVLPSRFVSVVVVVFLQ